MSRENRMKMIVEDFQNYVKTYSEQVAYQSYSDEVFLDDMLYGLGIAIGDEEFRYLNGYKHWKKILMNFLKTNKIESEIKDELKTSIN